MIKMKDMRIITALAVFSSFLATAYIPYSTVSDNRVACRRSLWYPKDDNSLRIQSFFNINRDESSMKHNFITYASNIDDHLDSKSDDDTFLHGLDEIQRHIVTENLSNIRVQAGPGSGKTRVLVSRIAYLIKRKNIEERNILAVTYTKKAANEMKSRLRSILGKDKNRIDAEGADTPVSKIGKTEALVLTCCTLHSLCCRNLRIHSELEKDREFTVLDTSDCIKIVKGLMKSKTDCKDFSPRIVHMAISTIKRQMLKKNGFQFEEGAYRIADGLMYEYDLTLQFNNAKDYDDIILHTVNLLLKNGSGAKAIRSKYQHILCDEWQDVDKSQYILMMLLLNDSVRLSRFGEDLEDYVKVNNIKINQNTPKYMEKVHGSTNSRRTLFVVGDSFQTIYSWRGADSKNLDYFEQDLPGCLSFKMLKNFRSHGEIVRACRSIMKIPPSAKSANAENVFEDEEKREMLERQAEESISEIGAQDPDSEPRVSVMSTNQDKDQAEFISHMVQYLLDTKQFEANEIAVMYRSHYLSESLQAAFISRNIGYRVIKGMSLLDFKEVKDALAYLNMLANPWDVAAIKRAINYPPRGVGKSTQDAFFNGYEERAKRMENTASSKPILELLIDIGKYRIKVVEKSPKKASERGSKKAVQSTTDSDDEGGGEGEEGDKELEGEVGKEGEGKVEGVREREREIKGEREGDADRETGLGDNGDEAQLESAIAFLTTRQMRALRAASMKIAVLQEYLESWEGSIEEFITQILVRSGIVAAITNSKLLAEPEIKYKLERLSVISTIARNYDKMVNESDAAFCTQRKSARERLRGFLDEFLLSADDDLEDDSRDGNKEKERKQAVNLLTIHASKGLEFDCVIISSVDEGSLPLFIIDKNGRMTDVANNATVSFLNYSHIEEERRLLYVGMTRARQKIIITYRNVVASLGYFPVQFVQPSRFLGRLPGHIEFCKYTSEQDIQRRKDKIHQDISSNSNKKAYSVMKSRLAIAKKETGTSRSIKKRKKSVVTETAESDS